MLEKLLGLESSVVTRRIKLSDGIFDGWLSIGPRLRGQWARIPVGNAIDPPPPALGTLAVAPIGDQQRAVAIDHQIGRLEAIGVGCRAGGEIDLLGRREAAAQRLPIATHHGSSPFAENQAAVQLAGKRRLSVTDAAG